MPALPLSNSITLLDTIRTCDARENDYSLGEFTELSSKRLQHPSFRMPEQSDEPKALARNALSKISGIFGRAQKPRWIQDFHILFSHSDPNRRYKPGEIVRGEVQIKPTKAIRVTHITVALYGYVQVFKNFNAPGEGQSREVSHTDPGRFLTSPGIVKLFTPVERTLHGECKLPSRLLRFQFAIPLPSHRLPTSIDFERGSIAYQLVATITRPTAIAPVLRCEPRRLYVNEDIDIAVIPAPKPRTVSLEPIETRSKTKRRKRGGRGSTSFDGGSNPPERPESSHSGETHSRSASRTSFAHSDNASISNYSASIEFRMHSNNSNASGVNNHNNTANSTAGSNRNSRSGPPPNNAKIVHASAEVLKGGFLPGDKIPVRVLVHHTKPIKSMCGVIITLYRKTHIDTQPVIHKAELNENGETSIKMITPDVYQKSMTGLSGLSLSNSGTSSTYRMDIAQAVVPLLINHANLSADITTTLEIPHESVTPTITKVRGQSIDFRYYVEVCLDLQGKLENSRLLPRLTAQPLYGFGKPSASGGASVPLSLAAHGNHLIDTQVIRRERPQIIAWQFHVVVGTRDSGRAAQIRMRDGWQHGDGPVVAPYDGAEESARTEEGLSDVQEEWSPDGTYELGRSLTNGANSYRGNDHVHEIGRDPGHGINWDDRISLSAIARPSGSSQMPPPPLTNGSSVHHDEAISEKERQRRHEQRLLPSQPPPVDGGAASSAAIPIASAPPAELVDGLNHGRWETEVSVGMRDSGYGSLGNAPNGPLGRPRLQASASYGSNSGARGEDERSLRSRPGMSHARSSNFDEHHQRDDQRANSVEQSLHREPSGKTPEVRPTPDGQTSNAAYSSYTSSSEDKQELERRRILSEQSAPHYDEPDQPTAAASSRRTAPAPSAPQLSELHGNEEHHHAAFGDWDRRQEELPRYER